MICSVGTLPLSDKAVYAHSLAMEKNLDSIRHAYQILSKTLGWVHLVGGNTPYFAGSADLRSRFSTKLLLVYKAHARPVESLIFDTFVVKSLDAQHAGDPAMTVVRMEEPPDLDGAGQVMINLIKRRPETTNEIHQVEYFEIKKSGVTHAYAIKHTTPPGYTAADVLRCVWTLVIDSSDVDSIVRAIQSQLVLPQDFEIDLFGCQAPQSVKHAPAIWYFIHRQDFGPALASLSRATYNVLRKYGQDAFAYLGRVVSP